MLAALPKSLNELQLQITTVSHDDQLVLLWFSQKSETTIRTYQGTIRQFFASFPERSLRDLKLEDLFIWVSSLQKYAQNTQRHKIFIIKSLFSFAHKVGYLQANPALMLKQPREVETVTERIITQSNIKVIAENCLKLRDELIIKTLYSLGLRVSELTVLTWHDFMFTDEGIKVKVQGKGSKIRFIHVPEFLYKELEKLRQDSQYIFSSRKKNNAGKLSRVQVYRIVKELGRRQDLQISPHYLRHSHATHSLKNGCDLKLLSDSLGHSNIAITSRYLHSLSSESSSKYIEI